MSSPANSSPCPTRRNANGEVCEHVVFHMCLAENSDGGELKIGIKPDMDLSRDANIGGWNNPTLIYALLAAGFSFCVWRTVGCQWRSEEVRVTIFAAGTAATREFIPANYTAPHILLFAAWRRYHHVGELHEAGEFG